MKTKQAWHKINSKMSNSISSIGYSKTIFFIQILFSVMIHICFCWLLYSIDLHKKSYSNQAEMRLQNRKPTKSNEEWKKKQRHTHSRVSTSSTVYHIYEQRKSEQNTRVSKNRGWGANTTKTKTNNRKCWCVDEDVKMGKKYNSNTEWILFPGK